MIGNRPLDRGIQIPHTMEAPPPQAAGSQVAGPAFNEHEPGTAGRKEMSMEPRMARSRLILNPEDLMRLDPVDLPDPMNGFGSHPNHGHQRASVPIHGCGNGGSRGEGHNLLNRGGPNPELAIRAQGPALKAGQPPGNNAGPPPAHTLAFGGQFRCNDLVPLPPSCPQDEPDRGSALTDPPFRGMTFLPLPPKLWPHLA